MKIDGINPKTYFCCFFALALILRSTFAFGATLNVPSQYSTIQPAIDAAVDGDTVQVADGTYMGSGNRDLDFHGKAITVQSENGPDSCIIDCDHRGRGFILGCEGPDSVISGFTITKGSAYRGGGIYCGSFTTITNCIITGNHSDADGGGIYCGSSTTITNCIITGNHSNGQGGGISGPASIYNCIISNNSAIQNGGGISMVGSIYNCTINGNTSLSYGGGIYSYSTSPTITNCIISRNMASLDGGGISCWQASPIITNCILFSNMAGDDGGGIDCNASSAAITNCTIVCNVSSKTNGGGGIHCQSSSFVTITNCIFWDNSPTEMSALGSTLPLVSYSDIQDACYGCSNTINTDPLFVGGDDYHLTSSSPCIDAGKSDRAPATDIDGNARPQGVGYDMGAHEYSSSLIANAGPDQMVFVEITLDGSQSYDADPEGGIVSYQWQLQHREDSAYDRTAQGETPTISNLQPGFYDVTITVMNDAGSLDSDDMLFTAIGCKSDFDRDGDGVPDVWDNCPNTPLNSYVNQYGCPCLMGDISGNGKIGLEEAIHALQVVSSLKAQ